MPSASCRFIVCLLVAVTWAERANAQAAAPPRVVPIEWLKTQPFPDTGKVALYEGEADTAGVAFAIPAGTVFSRCVLVVAAKEPGATFTVRLRNDLSTGWDRTEATGANGLVEIKYRTEGGAMALVQSTAGRQKFQLMVLQGKEIPVHKFLNPPFVSRDAARAPAAAPATPPEAAAKASEAPGTPVVYWVIAALLAGLLALGAIAVGRRKH